MNPSRLYHLGTEATAQPALVTVGSAQQGLTKPEGHKPHGLGTEISGGQRWLFLEPRAIFLTPARNSQPLGAGSAQGNPRSEWKGLGRGRGKRLVEGCPSEVVRAKGPGWKNSGLPQCLDLDLTSPSLGVREILVMPSSGRCFEIM